MNTAVINVRTDARVKDEAQKIAAELGLSLSSLITGYLRQLIKTKTVHFTLSGEEPSEYLVQALREAEEDRRLGRFKSFYSADEALSFVDKIIDESSKS